MKFTDGLWTSRGGYAIHHAHKVWEYHIEDDKIWVMAPCMEIRTMHDTTRGPVLCFTFSAPREDMIRVRIEHFTGTDEPGPFFTLYEQEAKPVITDGEKHIELQSGRTKVVIDKEGDLSYRFYYDGHLLTGSVGGTPAYITDADYEADKKNDYNGRNAPAFYLDKTYLRERLDLGVGEYIYGLGEHFTPVIKNGQEVDIWNRDGGSNSEQGYKNIPFHLSSRGYGVLVNTPARVDYEIGTESVRHTQFSVEGEALEYIVIGAAKPLEALEKYTALTGRSAVPPAWTFGLWLSTSWTPESNAEITLEFIDGMAARGIPLSVFHFDARWMDDFRDCDFVWSPRYGDAREMLRQIHERGVKVCCWINPYVSQYSRLFAEGKAGGYLLKNKRGGVWQTDVWMPGMGIVDFTNPEAAKWYAGRLGEIIDMGVDTIKTDFGERIPTEDVVWYDGSDPARMHNYYPYLYNQAIFGMLEEKLGKGGACVFSRSSTVGTQQFPVNWGGDNDSSYVSMAETLRGGLSFCQSGFGFWSHDMSGFCGTATPDLYKRWAAFGMLSTHSRLHGQETYRVPWCFDEESSEVLARFARLKCEMMPYLYEQANLVHLTGQPMLRAMMLDFPEDPTCLHVDRQYMLGERLLVAPIFEESGIARFYVPQGSWTDYLTGEALAGGRWYERAYDYFHLPLLVRPGSIIAVGSTDTETVYDYAGGTTYRLYLPEDGQAACRVFSAACQEVIGARAERTGNKLTFQLTGSDAAKAWRLALPGVGQAAKVSGGTVSQGGQGLEIQPEAGSTSVTIEL